MVDAVIIFKVCLSAALEINFEESDYSIEEGSSMLSSPITLQFKTNQNPFTVRLSSVTVDTAEDKGLGFFINSGTIAQASRATAGTTHILLTYTYVSLVLLCLLLIE